MNRIAGFVAMLMVWLASVDAQESQWDGIWVTEKGVFELTQNGKKIKGKVNKSGTIDGTVENGEFQFSYKNGRDAGSGKLKVVDEGRALEGTYKTRYQSGDLRGWKKLERVDGKSADFSGAWLSNLGTLMISQNEGKVRGTIGPEGWSEIKSGQVDGNELKFDWKIRNFQGKGWFQVAEDGKRIYGVLSPEEDPSPWFGIRPGDHQMEVQPEAGEVVKGMTANGMLYHLRMPEGWKSGDKTDVIILLHGSNWTTAGMVWVTAKNWPEIGKRYAILGIQGEQWATWSKADDLRFNYNYVSWVGRSTLGGFPYTNKSSPFLVGQMIDDFKKAYGFERVFVGGHSQGGYLTYLLHLNYPEKIDGTFPMSGGMIMQAEPDVFDDKDLMKAQRKTPMYILHGSQDNVVGVNYAEYAFERFVAHGFDRVHLETPRRGHPYDFLPVDKAIQWLDLMTTTDSKALAKFGKEQAADKNWKNVGMVIERAQRIDGGNAFSGIWELYNAAAKRAAEKIHKKIEANKDGKWVADYYEFRQQFGLSDKAEEVIEAFEALQKEHSEPAEEIFKEARKLFRSNRNKAYEKYEEIAEKYYASPRYLTVNRSLENRK